MTIQEFEYVINMKQKNVYHEISNSLEKYGFCIVKNFIDKEILYEKLKILRSKFTSQNDIRISGPLTFKMYDFQRLDLGDYNQENARFCRNMPFFTWNKGSVMIDVMQKLIDFRNDYLKLEEKNFLYEINGEKLCDLPKFLQYPVGGGFMNKHTDGVHYHGIMNVLLSLSKRGVDFETGGVYYYDKNGNYIDAEGILDIGDMYCHDTQTIHGVHAVDAHKSIDLNNLTGRLAVNLSLVHFEDIK